MEFEEERKSYVLYILIELFILLHANKNVSRQLYEAPHRTKIKYIISFFWNPQMNITILLDRSYKSAAAAPSDSLRLYKFMRALVERIPVKTINKFRFGAFGSHCTFLCRKKPSGDQKAHLDKGRRTDFLYQLENHWNTPHLDWTEDVKAELLFLLKGHPFQAHGYNNIREILQQVTQEGTAEVKADHVVILACWPMFENAGILDVMRQVASVTLVNLNKHWVTPEKIARQVHKLHEKYKVKSQNKTLTPYEKLHVSMLEFLQERAPVLLAEVYGPR